MCLSAVRRFLVSSSIKDILKDGLDETDIVPLVFTLMKVMDKFKELKGVEKKTILLEFLNDYIDNNIQDEDKKLLLKKIVSIVLPQAINLLAKINKLSIAITTREKISVLDPWNAANYLQQGKNYKAQGDLVKSSQMLEKILSFASNHPISAQAKIELAP